MTQALNVLHFICSLLFAYLSANALWFHALTTPSLGPGACILQNCLKLTIVALQEASSIWFPTLGARSRAVGCGNACAKLNVHLLWTGSMVSELTFAFSQIIKFYLFALMFSCSDTLFCLFQMPYNPSLPRCELKSLLSLPLPSLHQLRSLLTWNNPNLLLPVSSLTISADYLQTRMSGKALIHPNLSSKYHSRIMSLSRCPLSILWYSAGFKGSWTRLWKVLGYVTYIWVSYNRISPCWKFNFHVESSITTVLS